MKALVYVAPERMEIQEVPDPSPREGEVLLGVSAAGVCGSDIHGFLGHSERRKPGLVMGHEAVATILELHPSVTGWRRGQRVSFNPLLSCGGCGACLEGRQNLCPTWTLFGMDRLHGAYAERVAVGTAATRRTAVALAAKGARLVDSLDLIESRRVDIRDWTETRPLDDGHAGFVKMARDPGATLKLVLKP
jgi:threonine dehydrogenase-like Zn-dependent dehydrogenase